MNMRLQALARTEWSVLNFTEDFTIKYMAFHRKVEGLFIVCPADTWEKRERLFFGHSSIYDIIVRKRFVAVKK